MENLQSKISELNDMANKLRIHSIKATNASSSGHPTSCSSMAELMSVLFFDTMRYDVANPLHRSSDRFVLSKGHAAPILYAAWAEAGLFPTNDLLNLRKIDSDLEGHPTPRLNFIDVGTGSLGQGLSVGCGMAYVGKYYDKASYRVYVLVGDGESAEGSIWEALSFASHYKLDNLCVIFDINRLGQSEPTALQHDMSTYKQRVEAFGLNSIIVDGHDVSEIAKAFNQAKNTSGKPTAILAKTFKGKEFPEIENLENWHGKPIGTKAATIIEHLEQLIRNNGPHKMSINKITDDAPVINIKNITLSSPPNYTGKEQIATRLAYGTALAKLAQNSSRIIALDGDTKNSTFSEKIKTVNPSQFIECFIAEQNLVGVAMGVSCRDRAVAFVSTFAAFFTRAFDQIRMGAISRSNVNFVGSHCGISIGEDGPSQMGLEDIALFRTIPGSTVFYPSDAVSAERAVELAANTEGICYIRTSRPNLPILYSNNETFKIGECKVIRSTPNDQLLIIAAAVTLKEAVQAAEQLAKDGISVRVIDPFTIKPLDKNIAKHIAECKGRVLVVEDHYPEGGIGEAVCSQFNGTDVKINLMAVREVPRSGPPAALLEKYGISSSHIATNAKKILL